MPSAICRSTGKMSPPQPAGWWATLDIENPWQRPLIRPLAYSTWSYCMIGYCQVVVSRLPVINRRLAGAIVLDAYVE